MKTIFCLAKKNSGAIIHVENKAAYRAGVEDGAGTG
jgi:hypothetical protein